MDMITLLTLDPRTPMLAILPSQAYGFHAGCMAKHAQVKYLLNNARPIEPDDALSGAGACWYCGGQMWTL